MSIIDVCRVCLKSYVPLRTIVDTPLQELYEKITSSLLLEYDKPKQLCCACHALLKTLYTFTTKAVKSNELLTQIIQSGALLSQCHFSEKDQETFSSLHLTISPVENISIEPKGFIYLEEKPVKNEAEVIDSTDDIALPDANVNTEISGIIDGKDFKDTDLHEPPNPASPKSDSEDDIPLNKIRLESQKGRRNSDADAEVTKDTVVRKIREKNLMSTVKGYAREIILTQEQQIEELLVRAKSANYLNSPFRCETCFKGFQDKNAFDNHSVKHEKTSGMFKCDICLVRYRSGRLLRAHALTAHSRRYECLRCQHCSHTVHQARDHERWHVGYLYDCKLCGHKFRKPTSYLTHKRKHHPAKHVCTLCGDACVSLHGLKMHYSKAHARTKINKTPDNQEPAADRFCPVCNIQFLRKKAWNKHILTAKVHREERNRGDSLQCKICLTVLPSIGALLIHTRDHLRALQTRPVKPKVPATCDQCSRQFCNISKLHAHVKRVHLGIKYTKEIICEQCGNKFTTNAALVYHQRSHTGERPFHCNICPKAFADSNHLKIHIRIHTGERPYSCSVCGKRFSQKPALNRHSRVHTGARPYVCQLCSKSFTQSNSLKLHVKAVHLKIPTQRKKTVNSGRNQQNKVVASKDSET